MAVWSVLLIGMLAVIAFVILNTGGVGKRRDFQPLSAGSLCGGHRPTVTREIILQIIRVLAQKN